MKLKVGVEAVVYVDADSPALLQIEIDAIPNVQTVTESSLSVEPGLQSDYEQFADLYGNQCRRLMFSSGENRIRYSAVVEQPDLRVPDLLSPVETSAIDLPSDVLHFMLPSRYCQSDRLVKLATDTFGHHPPGYARVLTICNWINEHIAYQYGTSNANTSAIDTLIERQGVCRDFAHLAIAFCRALNIPARYISGYCLGLNPPDFHAYFQAYLDGRWVSFDATEVQPRPALVRVAIGRDASDCAWCTIYRGLGQTNSLVVAVDLVN